jgi:hypothetical protein
LRISPLVGFGFSVGGPPNTDDTVNISEKWLNYSVGINFEYGIKNRVIFGSQFIGAYYIADKETIDKRMFVGTSFIVGYKGIASFGLIWQIYLGVAHIQSPLMIDMKYFYQPNFGFGIGYKF